MAERRAEDPSPPRRITRSKRSLRASDDGDSSPPKHPTVTVKKEPDAEEEEPKALECAVCLQTCIHPARLPCKHIFCFLCLKGITHGSRQCAMCRSPIPPDYLDHPDLLEMPSCSTDTSDEGYQWFYEGRNGGWWRYEERTSQEIEENRDIGVTRFETMICGSLYIIDLFALTQVKKDNPWQKRKIMRELPSKVVVKGVAGISRY